MGALAGAGRESRDRAVVPSAAELVEQLKEIARLRAEGALTESEFKAVKGETALGRRLGLRSWSDASNGEAQVRWRGGRRLQLPSGKAAVSDPPRSRLLTAVNRRGAVKDTA
jgi:hypothetical protein